MTETQKTRQVVVRPNGEQATWYVAEQVENIISRAVDERGVCSLALAGGTTPHGLYLMLAGAAVSGQIPWQDVQVFFGDERDVPQDHIESNYHMAQRTLLDHIPIQPGRVHPMPADTEDMAGAAAEYEATIRRIVPAAADVPNFDLILLGMGGEGHVASLFPGTEALNEADKLVTAYFVPVLGRERMTFTYPLLNAARNVILLVTGADKGRAVAELFGQDKPSRNHLPAAGVAPTDGVLLYVLDAAAAKPANLKSQDD